MTLKFLRTNSTEKLRLLDPNRKDEQMKHREIIRCRYEVG